jgi:hypothetical protein
VLALKGGWIRVGSGLVGSHGASADVGAGARVGDEVDAGVWAEVYIGAEVGGGVGVVAGEVTGVGA